MSHPPPGDARIASGALTERPAQRLALAAFVLVFGTLVAVLLRELSLGASAMETCGEAMAHADLPGAIDAAREAAEATAPGSPYPERGYARLVEIAQAAETRGDDATATAAWRAIRAAAMATQTPLGARARQHAADANLGIARVAAHPRTVQPETAEATRALMLATLARDDRPSPWTFVLLGVGASAFFAGVIRLLLLPTGTTRRQLGIGASVAAAGFALALLACLRG